MLKTRLHKRVREPGTTVLVGIGGPHRCRCLSCMALETDSCIGRTTININTALYSCTADDDGATPRNMCTHQSHDWSKIETAVILVLRSTAVAYDVIGDAVNKPHHMIAL